VVRAFQAQVDAFVRAGTLASAAAEPLLDGATRLVP
jgi:hypothetical protein